MSQAETMRQVEGVMAEVSRIIETKNADYADAWRQEGWRGSVGKLLAKSSRLRNLLWRPVPHVSRVGETAEQTLLDVIAHASFALLNLRAGREWGHEPDWEATQTTVTSYPWDGPASSYAQKEGSPIGDELAGQKPSDPDAVTVDDDDSDPPSPMPRDKRRPQGAR